MTKRKSKKVNLADIHRQVTAALSKEIKRNAKKSKKEIKKSRRSLRIVVRDSDRFKINTPEQAEKAARALDQFLRTHHA